LELYKWGLVKKPEKKNSEYENADEKIAKLKTTNGKNGNKEKVEGKTWKSQMSKMKFFLTILKKRRILFNHMKKDNRTGKTKFINLVFIFCVIQAIMLINLTATLLRFHCS